MGPPQLTHTPPTTRHTPLYLSGRQGQRLTYREANRRIVPRHNTIIVFDTPCKIDLYSSKQQRNMIFARTVNFLVTLCLLISVNAGENKISKQKIPQHVSKPNFFLNPILSKDRNVQQQQHITNSNPRHPLIHKKSRNSLNLNSLELAKKVAISIRDEVVDCFDSILYAESNKERFDNLIDIGYRHRGLIFAGSFCVVAKVGLSQTQCVRC